MGLFKDKITDKVQEVKIKSDAIIESVTNKVFDVNLLKAIKKDFDFIIEQQNDIIKANVFLYQILKMFCEEKKIEIPQHIKNHFRLE